MKLTPPIYAIKFKYIESQRDNKFHLVASQQVTDPLISENLKEPIETVCRHIVWGYEVEYVEFMEIKDINPDQICQHCARGFVVSENDPNIEQMKEEIKRLRSIVESIGFTEPNPIEWIEPS